MSKMRFPSFTTDMSWDIDWLGEHQSLAPAISDQEQAEKQQIQTQMQFQTTAATQSGALIGSSYIIAQGSTIQTGVSNDVSWYTGAPPRWEPPPPSPASDFLSSIEYLDPVFVKEIVIQEPVYMEIVKLLDLKDEQLKSFEYSTMYGRLLIKNEKYQFDLDKYIKDGPSEEK